MFALLDFAHNLPFLMRVKRENTFPAGAAATGLKHELLSSRTKASYMAEKMTTRVYMISIHSGYKQTLGNLTKATTTEFSKSRFILVGYGHVLPTALW